MRLTVIWSPIAEDQLTELWLNATDRNAVTAAQHQIDQLLRVDPDQQGIPFFGNRLLLVAPLHAAFTINWQDMQVEVYDVW
jgi:hypothetical protein